LASGALIKGAKAIYYEFEDATDNRLVENTEAGTEGVMRKTSRKKKTKKTSDQPNLAMWSSGSPLYDVEHLRDPSHGGVSKHEGLWKRPKPAS
jgi:hypothetical protein